MMIKPLALSIALALVSPLPVFAQDTTANPSAEQSTEQATPTAATPAWVEQSNQYAQILIDAQGPFQPEQTSFFGLADYDGQISDLRPGSDQRFREATAEAKKALEKKLADEKDPNVRQDLAILIGAAEEAIESSRIREDMVLPWSDIPKLVFTGMQSLLNEQTTPERRAKALERLKRYAGGIDGTTPIATLARQQYETKVGDDSLLKPTRIEIEQAVANQASYAKGIRELFTEYKIDGADATLDALDKQMADYVAWSRDNVLPDARTDYSLPATLYALQLKQVGIDIEPRTLIERAQLEFMETRAAMQQIAPLIARQRGFKSDDYRDVIREMKKDQFAREQIEPHYRNKVMPELDRLIAEHDVVSLPERPMQMRLASEAESAAQSAPHFLPAPLVGNTGQQGTFVLPLGNPNAGAEGAYDDFNFPAVAWTLTAHEGRPGHELQFTAMVERGVSLARTLFAFNSVNVEGWALYAEAEMVPYEPLEGQLFALQFRLLRAARAILDPMLNLGDIDRGVALRVLTDDVVLSNAMAHQEVDRYTVNAPGQAGSYFYGYSRIMQLRAETELKLGDKFDRKAFNDFLLDQGLLPPDLLSKAVREEFVPAQQAKE